MLKQNSKTPCVENYNDFTTNTNQIKQVNEDSSNVNICVPKSLINSISNDMLLGEKIRKIYYKMIN